MKGYAMIKIGQSDWIEKPRLECGPLDQICKPLAVAICTSDVHTLVSHVFDGWEHLEETLFLMRDKPRDLIKPVVRIHQDK